MKKRVEFLLFFDQRFYFKGVKTLPNFATLSQFTFIAII